jgi:hypothetical protein
MISETLVAKFNDFLPILLARRQAGGLFQVL